MTQSLRESADGDDEAGDLFTSDTHAVVRSLYSENAAGAILLQSLDSQKREFGVVSKGEAHVLRLLLTWRMVTQGVATVVNMSGSLANAVTDLSRRGYRLYVGASQIQSENARHQRGWASLDPLLHWAVLRFKRRWTEQKRSASRYVVSRFEADGFQSNLRLAQTLGQMQLPLDVVLSNFHRLGHGAKLKALAALMLNEYVHLRLIELHVGA